jgi:hypothetical protein
MKALNSETVTVDRPELGKYDVALFTRVGEVTLGIYQLSDNVPGDVLEDVEEVCPACLDFHTWSDLATFTDDDGRKYDLCYCEDADQYFLLYW